MHEEHSFEPSPKLIKLLDSTTRKLFDHQRLVVQKFWQVVELDANKKMHLVNRTLIEGLGLVRIQNKQQWKQKLEFEEQRAIRSESYMATSTGICLAYIALSAYPEFREARGFKSNQLQGQMMGSGYFWTLAMAVRQTSALRSAVRSSWAFRRVSSTTMNSLQSNDIQEQRGDN